MICSDIWHKYHDWHFEIVLRNLTSRNKVSEIWGNFEISREVLTVCQISLTNHSIICLYYYPRKVCDFHMKVFQIKLNYHCPKPIEFQKFLT